MRCAGFSLIQLSIVITVIGIVIAATLPGNQGGTQIARQGNTSEKMAKIEQALKGWRTANRVYPCPAVGALRSSDINFGKATGAAGTCAGAITDGNTVGGVVPTRTLGLSDDDMLDNWGRTFYLCRR